jgi:uncharacterized integral membrane protein
MSIQDRIDRRQERRDFKNFVPSNQEEEQYYNAAKRVKRIKGFYTHAMVYVVINIMFVIINIQNLDPGESYFQWHNFTTLFFWGIGLTAHAASVFVPELIFGKNWEERKIKEYMEKERQQNKWE